jgi:hypothetical protein
LGKICFYQIKNIFYKIIILNFIDKLYKRRNKLLEKKKLNDVMTSNNTSLTNSSISSKSPIPSNDVLPNKSNSNKNISSSFIITNKHSKPNLFGNNNSTTSPLNGNNSIYSILNNKNNIKLNESIQQSILII